jgi:hypothetical protein
LSRWALSKPLALGSGFGADDGATLLMAIRGIQAETAQQGDVHKAIARELQHLVADPFEGWAKGYHVCHGDYFPVIQLTALRRRGCSPVGLTSLMATSRTTNEVKPRYASFSLSVLGRPAEALRCRLSNSRIRIFPKFARQMRLKTSKYSSPLHTACYNTHWIAASSSHRIARLVTNIPRRPVSSLATNLSEPQLSRNVSLRVLRTSKGRRLI